MICPWCPLSQPIHVRCSESWRSNLILTLYKALKNSQPPTKVISSPYFGTCTGFITLINFCEKIISVLNFWALSSCNWEKEGLEVDTLASQSFPICLRLSLFSLNDVRLFIHACVRLIIEFLFIALALVWQPTGSSNPNNTSFLRMPFFPPEPGKEESSTW